MMDYIDTWDIVEVRDHPEAGPHRRQRGVVRHMLRASGSSGKCLVVFPDLTREAIFERMLQLVRKSWTYLPRCPTSTDWDGERLRSGLDLADQPRKDRQRRRRRKMGEIALITSVTAVGAAAVWYLIGMGVL